jgi:PleD family two-component response regulator
MAQTDPTSTVRQLAVVFENMIALAQDGEQYLSELHAIIAQTTPAPNAFTTKPTVLLVDDDGPLLRSMVRSLRDSFELTTASTIEQALSIIDAQPFDAVICDFHLPGGDGIRTQRLRLCE